MTKEIFEFSHYYTEFEQQKFWDFFVDHEWYTQSDIMPGKITLIDSEERQEQGVGTVRKIVIDKINLVEDIVGFDAPKYFSYVVRDDGMPVKGYRGEIFLEPQEKGLTLKYRGSFESKLFGTNWLFKYLFLSRMRKMAPVWAEGYKTYHNESNKRVNQDAS